MREQIGDAKLFRSKEESMKSLLAWIGFAVVVQQHRAVCTAECFNSSAIAIESWEDLVKFCGEQDQMTIPESIGQLSNLERFFLSLDRTVGTIPDSFGQLTKLTYLDLHNYLFDSLPETVGQLTQLSFCRLLDNEMRTLPESFGHLTKLTELWLWFSNLETLPRSFGELTMLEKLSIYYSNLTSMPDTLGHFTRLRDLTLTASNVQTLPDSLGLLTNLTALFLPGNKLQALPEALGQLTNLSDLIVSSNQLDRLPESIRQLTQLSRLSLSNNLLRTLPASVGELTKLTQLGVANNLLSSLDESIGQLASLSTLDLSNNSLQYLPDSFGMLADLTTLELSRNQLVTLPESFGNLASLTELVLVGNNLQTIPDSLTRLGMNLRELLLNENHLQFLPDSFGELRSVETLNVSSNQLVHIPVSIHQLSKLTSLDLSYNDLQSLPESIANLTSLRAFKVNDNELRFLPAALSQLSELQVLSVHNNRLVSLPTNLGSIRDGKTTLWLFNNPFTCSRSFLEWFDGIDPKRMVNVDNVQCSSVNEFAGFPVHRVRFLPDEPETNPTLHHWQSLAPDVISLTWLFGDLENTRSLASSSQSTFIFNCDQIQPRSILGSPSPTWLIFQTEWRAVGGSMSWTSMCTNDTVINIENLEPNTMYDVRVRAIYVRWDVYDEVIHVYTPRLSAGPRTPTERIKTLPDVPGGPPRNFTVATEYTRESSLTLRWEPPAIPNSDIIEYSVLLVDKDKLVAQNIKETTAIINGLDPGSTYEFRVKARSPAGDGPWSDSLRALTKDTCPQGTQRLETEAYPCEACPFDTFRSDLGVRECSKCPVDKPHTLSVGTRSLSECIDGAAFLEFVSKEKRLLKKGFWRISKETLRFQACPKSSFCEPTQPQEASAWEGPDQYCSDKHTGVFCSSCVSWYVLKSSGCEVCDLESQERDSRLLKAWLAVGVLIVLAPSAFLSYRLAKALFSSPTSLSSASTSTVASSSSSSAGSCWCCSFQCQHCCERTCSQPCSVIYHNCCEPCSRVDEEMLQDVAVTVRVLVGFFQVFLLFVYSSGILESGQRGVQVVINLDLGAFLDALDVSCAWDSDFYDSLLVYTLFPLLCIVFMFLVVATAWSCRVMFASMLGLAIWTTLQLLFFVYPGTSSKVFETFRYESFQRWPGDTEPNRTLSSEYSIDFDSEESARWRIYAGLMVIVYPVGVLALFIMMVRVGKKLESSRASMEVADEFCKSVAFLSRPYTWAYFECYGLFRKLVLTSMFLLVQQETFGGAEVFFQASAIVFCAILLERRPYLSGTTFAFAVFSSFLLVVVGTLPFALRAIEGVSPTTLEGIVFALIVLECVAFGAAVIGHGWHASLRRQKRKMGSFVQTFQTPVSDDEDLRHDMTCA